MAATKVRRRRRQRRYYGDAKVWAIGGAVGLGLGLLTLVLAALFWDKSMRHGDIAAVGGDVEIPVTLFSILTFGLGVSGVALGGICALIVLLLGRGWQRWAGAGVLIVVWSCVMWTRHDGRLPYGMTYSSCDGFFHSSNVRLTPPAFDCTQNVRSSSAKWRPLLPYARAFDPKNTSVHFLSPSAVAIAAQQNIRDGQPLMEFALVIQGPANWHSRKLDQSSVKVVRTGVYAFEYTFGTTVIPVEYDSARKSLRVLGQQSDLAEDWILVVQLDDSLKQVQTAQRVAAPRFAIVGNDVALALVNGARLDRMVSIAPCWPAQFVCESVPEEEKKPSPTTGETDKPLPG